MTIPKKTKLKSTGNDRGVSEVVAFVLIFAIIIGSVGILYTTGFQSMTSYQEGEQLRNAERAMGALASNFNDLQRNGGIQERAGELNLRDGTIRTGGNGTNVTVDVLDESYNESHRLGAITYQKGSSVIAYDGGGVFRGVDGEPSQSVVLERPRLACNPESETAVISLLKLESDGGVRSFQSSGSLELTVVRNTTEVHTVTGAGGVNVTVTDSPFENGWSHALDRNGWEWDGVDTGTCADAKTVTVRIVSATVEY